MPRHELLSTPITHIDPRALHATALIEGMAGTAFQARNLARAAEIFAMMIREPKGGVILTLAGSLISAGQKKVVATLVREHMVDCIVSTGANMVDQDFFEGLGYQHYIAHPRLDDNELREARIDRIYDTLIDEDELRVCDMTIADIASALPPRPYSSREFLSVMGAYLKARGKDHSSILEACYDEGVPVFVPAFSDCSAGFGLVHHQWHNKDRHATIDSAQDFLELTQLTIAAGETGLLMIGGGVPKNFTQDVVVAADILGQEVSMHKYAVQITVADERDGALSGSTLREASSWGKVETTFEQMVYAEATLVFPLLAAYALEQNAAQGRTARRYADAFAAIEQPKW